MGGWDGTNTSYAEATPSTLSIRYRAGDLKPYLKVPILVLWGDYVDQSPRWAPRSKACRAFAEAATKAGGRVENIVLPDIGIKGGSHILMQDKNSLEVADWLYAWIDRNIERARR